MKISYKIKLEKVPCKSRTDVDATKPVARESVALHCDYVSL